LLSGCVLPDHIVYRIANKIKKRKADGRNNGHHEHRLSKSPKDKEKHRLCNFQKDAGPKSGISGS